MLLEEADSPYKEGSECTDGKHCLECDKWNFNYKRRI